MAHLDGHKIWIVWPPTEHNLRAIRHEKQALGPDRELRLQRWLQELQQPEVFLIQKGDSFFLGPSVVHACISVTKSAHYGLFCWRREALGVAQLNMRILQEGFKDLAKALKEQEKKRKREDREKDLTATQRRNRDEDRKAENAHADACLTFYRSCRSDWDRDDKVVWRKMSMDMQDTEIVQWTADVEKFMGQIKPKVKQITYVIAHAISIWYNIYGLSAADEDLCDKILV